MNFLKSNFWEINRSPLLHHFGAILSFLHILNYFYWKTQSHLLKSLSAKPLLCWDFFSGCASSNGPLNHTGLVTLFNFYLVFSSIAFLIFLMRRFTSASWFFLLFSNIISLFFYIYDAGLMHDIYGLLLFLNIAFLFCVNKSPLIRAAVVLFYLYSGYRELNSEWLTGNALASTLPYSLKVLEWVAACGVIIKLTLPFLLISSVGQRLTIAILGLSAYHILHFYFFKDFTSAAFVLFNFYFVLEFFVKRQLEREAYYQSYSHPEPSKLWWPIAFSIYLFAQSPLTTAHSPLQLVRIKGPQTTYSCEHFNFIKFDNRLEQIDLVGTKDLSSDVKCHPIVAFNSSKEICEKYRHETGFQSVSSYFLRKKMSQTKFDSVFSLQNICDPKINFKSIKANL